MGAHGSQITPEDRWKIIEYIKVKLQGKKLGERTISVIDDSPKESIADFEARLSKLYPNQKGVGPVKSLSLETINNKMAEEGQKIYKQMCSSCHKPTKRYIGPAPIGILERRTPEWVMNMILNPKEMVAKDPIAKELLGRYISPMADQNLSEEEARKVLEYFRTLK
ncbi:cytochrome c [Ancylomarina salipaludis]|uniref:Cytochrome c n=2 Tax=Ancylomarina salipaludis TaxID=2501299 RepID=A0A4Q1JPJ6_9BACT|nr:cytochrome c [Ancylomarina salipaludis]